MAVLIAIVKIAFGFTLLIGIHEFGHAVAAWLSGVKVKRFSIGMGPGWKFKNVPIVNELILSPLVIGGYVQLDEEYLNEASFWKKFFISVAGMVANVLTAAFLLILVGKNVVESLYLCFFIWIAGWPMAIKLIAEGKVHLHDAVSGPIGIGQMMAGGSSLPYLAILAIINLGVAMMNLLPTLPMDGGQIVIAVLEKIIGKNAARKVGNVMMIVGLILLLAVFVFATANDLIKISNPSK